MVYFGAVSSLKCNTGDVVEFEFGEDFVRCTEAEDFARPVIEGVLDGVEFVLSDEVEIHALGQVLADEAIGIFIGATLPRAVWITEEDVHAQPPGQSVVLSHLGALVVGEGLAQARGDAAQAEREAFEHGVGASVIELDEHEVAAGALDDGAHGRGIVGTLDEVAFPVTWDDACGNLWRAQVTKSCP